MKSKRACRSKNTLIMASCKPIASGFQVAHRDVDDNPNMFANITSSKGFKGSILNGGWKVENFKSGG
ncbi:MAG: hypothetical protein K8R34_06830 [Methanosarcinales archaeon]|jgi:hypothetical protein|nr:hypothetical protein [Methanosarcinales archaeon]